MTKDVDLEKDSYVPKFRIGGKVILKENKQHVYRNLSFEEGTVLIIRGIEGTHNCVHDNRRVNFWYHIEGDTAHRYCENDLKSPCRLARRKSE